MEGGRFAKSLWGKLDREVREISGHDPSTSKTYHTMCLHSCVKNKYLTKTVSNTNYSSSLARAKRSDLA